MTRVHSKGPPLELFAFELDAGGFAVPGVQRDAVLAQLGLDDLGGWGLGPFTQDAEIGATILRIMCGENLAFAENSGHNIRGRCGDYAIHIRA